MQLMRLTQEGYDALWAEAEQNLPRYQAGDAAYFQQHITEKGWLEPTGLEVPDFADSLQPVGSERTADTIAAADRHNAPLIYESLRALRDHRALAVDPRLWAALLHTTLFSYVYEYFGDDVAKDRQGIGKNFFVTGNGQKRSIFVNCASRLWWACELLYDEAAEDPYHYLGVIEHMRFGGSLTLLSSSNIAEQREVVHGLFHVLEERLRAGQEVHRLNEMTWALRYLNLIAGATVIDVLNADDIADLVRTYFSAWPKEEKAFELDNAPA